MTQPSIAPYGSWKSPITADLVAAGRVGLAEPRFDGEDVYWLEGRPLEGGRNVIVRRSAGGVTEDVTPPGFNVRTRVHEYGGGAYLPSDGAVYFSNFVDQRLYRQEVGGEPRPITPEPAIPAGLRYADGRVTPDGRTFICVRERHEEGREAINEIVAIPTDGSSDPTVLLSGRDFYSSQRISPEGSQLTWLTWDHPRMPWDGSEVWVADLVEDGRSVGNPRRLAGGPDESIFQPEWSPEGVLYFVSDRTGWWNLYRLTPRGEVESLAPMQAELGLPQWVFGLATYAFLPDGRIACTYQSEGVERLAILDPDSGVLDPLDVPYTTFGGTLSSSGSWLAFVGASPTEAAAVVSMDVPLGALEVLRRGLEVDVDPGYVSAPEPVEFPTSNGQMAHALFYPPANRDFVGPAEERPPLLVMSHGGPTSSASAAFSLGTQFWTSRGIAVVDVNYGGSTGYGRAYRDRLKGQWGIVDVEDCINAARYLAQEGRVDGQRMAIRGGSAGGYTTLCALTFHQAFAAGASYYGVADCETLARDTHKFESRYLDGLIGPYPEARATYEARSPIHFTDRLSCPVILFQGLEDRVVPPAQAETMAEALRAKGLPFAYLAFEGEQHGFRRAETIKRTLEAELYFYSRVFKFRLADEIEPVAIENL